MGTDQAREAGAGAAGPPASKVFASKETRAGDLELVGMTQSFTPKVALNVCQDVEHVGLREMSVRREEGKEGGDLAEDGGAEFEGIVPVVGALEAIEDEHRVALLASTWLHWRTVRREEGGGRRRGTYGEELSSRRWPGGRR